MDVVQGHGLYLRQNNTQRAWFSALPDAHIALSDNGWTDNEIGLEWFKKCFEPETRCGDDEYRLLILDGHASHITTAAIRFCIASKIIPLCLPPHTTHFLQPLDIGIFSPLATAYKAGVRERSKYIVSYSIDKIDFLEIYNAARDKAITPTNIGKAWKSAGLEPWDPELVLKQLPKRPSIQPTTPPLNITQKGPTCNEASEGQGHAGSGDQTVPNKATLKLPDYDRS